MVLVIEQRISRREEIGFNFFCFTTMEKSLAFTLEFCLTLRWGGEFRSDGYYFAIVCERGDWLKVKNYIQKKYIKERFEKDKAVLIFYTNDKPQGYS